MSPRVWLITGTSSGFGRDMTELLLKRGEIVIATARKPEVLDDIKARYPATQFIALKLDVDNVKDIENAFAEAKKAFGRIDVVFSNAGWAAVAETEAHPEEEARKIFDTNFWGSTNVSREAVRFFREENRPAGGRLLVNSSISGIRSVPGLAYYSASKHAIEGITQALSWELDPSWNIKVSLIEPGAFNTSGPQKVGATAVSGFTHPAYSSPTLPSNGIRKFLTDGASEGLGGDPAKAVQRIYDLSVLSSPPLHFVVGKDAITSARDEIKSIEEDVTKYESWSEGLDFDV